MEKKEAGTLKAELKNLLKNKGGNDLKDISQEDKRLQKLINTVVKEVNLYANFQLSHIKRLAKIGLALSVEKDINILLEMIVDAARDLTFADAGTLYLVDTDKNNLHFEILQNDTMKTRMGGTSGVEVTLPPVPLEVGGKPNHSNVSSYCALTGEIVNIPDVYEAEGFDFTGPRKYDEATGYRSTSMLVIPMRNHENDIIGVLQLLNAKDIETEQVVPFSKEYVELIASLASQAAVALTNAHLIKDLQALLYAFIKSIATAIDEKSPYTGGHFDRVVELTMMIAEKMNDIDHGPFATVDFSDDELEELKIAAWMHDVGKITTPEHVVDKGTKLETIFDRVHLVETRFDLIGRLIENDVLARKVKALENGKAGEKVLKALDEELKPKLDELEEEKSFIVNCNIPKEFMDDDRLARLKEIAEKTYSFNGESKPYLTENEVYNLSIRKGSLTDEERHVIENHASLTMKMLNQLPFPKKLANVPTYASGHHEKLDGSGYPLGLKASDLPLQARVMAVADVFEALTARDRPYKKPMKLSMAVKILGFMKKDQHIDPDIFDLFINENVYREYAEKQLDPEQLDDLE